MEVITENYSKLININLYIKETDYNYFYKKMEDHKQFSLEEIKKLEENYSEENYSSSFLFMFKAFFNRSNRLYSAKLCFKGITEFNGKSKSWLLRRITI